MQIKSAKGLTVYKKAYEQAMQIFDVSKYFPTEVRYALTSFKGRPIWITWKRKNWRYAIMEVAILPLAVYCCSEG